MKGYKNKNNFDYLSLALMCFLGLGMEIAVIILEVMFYRINMDNYTCSMQCMHLVFTIIVWLLFISGLIMYAEKRLGFNVFSENAKPSNKRIILSLLILLIMTFWQYIDWDGLKILKEFEHNGLIKGILQHIYYFGETGLVTLLIIFGQKYGEKKFEKCACIDRIPWGGIILAITWGAVHMLTKGILCGIETIMWSVVFGLTYLILSKNTKLTYIFITLMFIL